MARRDISRLCQAVLPPGFEQIRRQLPQLQEFLQENLPESVQQCVTLLSVDDDHIVIAANTPMVTNYLRLHSNEIQQQLRETFQMEQELRFRTVPDALFQRRKPREIQAPRAVSSEAIDFIKRNAQWIEDDELRAAMLALADTLSGDSLKDPSV
jgi:hypothetical protein